MDAVIETYLSETFEKIRPLRQTGRGEVWLASAPSGEIVILKRVFRDGLPYGILESHPHPLWPAILYCAEDAGETVIIEEYVAGESLRQRLEKSALFTEEEAVRVLLDLCDGLTVLHGLGIIHRDIKPSNLILATGGIRLIDFDAARTRKENQAEDTALLGTKGYAPPEQFGYGQTDARSDLYAVGVTIGKMLGPDYRGLLTPVLAKCTELDPRRRYASARELKRAVLRRRRWAKAKPACILTLPILVAAALCLLPPRLGTPPPAETPPAAEALQPPANAPLSSGETPPPAVENDAPAASEPAKTANSEGTGEEERVPQGMEAPITTPEAAPPATSPETSPAPTPDEPPRNTTPDEEAAAFLALFANNPHKLAYWQQRKEGYFEEIEARRLPRKETDEAKREALDTMRRGELGLRAEEFQKTLPKTMTPDEKGRALNEFVAEQLEILGITDW